MKNVTQKIIAGTLVFSIIFSCIGLIQPKKAEAQWAVFDAGNIIQSTISAVSNIGTSFSTYSAQYKEFVLDGIAYMIAKQILRQMTSSIVNWINSGFEGSPSFVTDPAGFFVDVADQLTGEFISQSGALSQLCTNINLDLRIALALKYRPYSQRRYACTLSTVIANAKSSVKNASINGFTAGDFKQGGWPAFVSLTTEPQNNYIGAYILASDDLSYQIANKSVQQRDELNQGQGFLSWKTCKDAPVSGDSNFVGPVAPGQGSNVVGSNFVGPVNTAGGQVQRKKVCETQTPGKVISGALETQLGSPVRELELADEFNEIINALFAQLVTTVLTGGLAGASGNGPSDSGAYLNQLQQEVDTRDMGATRDRLIKDIDLYLKNAQGHRFNKAQSLAAVMAVKDLYNQVKACYIQGGDTASASSIDQYVVINITPVFNKLAGEMATLDQGIAELTSIKALAQNATTSQTLSEPSNRFGTLLQSQSLVSAGDVIISKEEISTIKNQMQPFTNDAQQKLRICQLTNSTKNSSN
jgi:hypothetical protein